MDCAKPNTDSFGRRSLSGLAEVLATAVASMTALLQRTRRCGAPSEATNSAGCQKHCGSKAEPYCCRIKRTRLQRRTISAIPGSGASPGASLALPHARRGSARHFARAKRRRGPGRSLADLTEIRLRASPPLAGLTTPLPRTSGPFFDRIFAGVPRRTGARSLSRMR